MEERRRATRAPKIATARAPGPGQGAARSPPVPLASPPAPGVISTTHSHVGAVAGARWRGTSRRPMPPPRPPRARRAHGTCRIGGHRPRSPRTSVRPSPPPRRSARSGRTAPDGAVSGRYGRGRTAPAGPTARLTKKIVRRLISLRTPPVAGPAAASAEPPIAQIETARACWPGPANASRSSASEAGTITAAPAPCTSRVPISTPRFGADPQSAEAATNTARPAPRTPGAHRSGRSRTAPADPGQRRVPRSDSYRAVRRRAERPTGRMGVS